MVPRACGEVPLVSGASGRGFLAVFRGLVFVLFRPSRVCGGFVFPFLALRLALVVIVVVVSRRPFFGFAFGVGSFAWRRVCV